MVMVRSEPQTIRLRPDPAPVHPVRLAIKQLASQFTSELKATMRWTGYGGNNSHWGLWGTATWGTLGATNYNYNAVADGTTNAAVVACVRWLQRNFPEAPTQVVRTGEGGQLVPIPAHPLAKVLTKPNEYYSGLHLWSATVADLTYTGNAYWLKVRSETGRPVELWWVPSTNMEPRWPDSGTTFISHYDYKVNGEVYRVPVKDVVHFRDGFDPLNIRKGLSPLASLAREIVTDDEAANWTSALLRNSAVPGVVISPDTDLSPTKAEMEELKANFITKFTGDRRGEPLVMQGKTKVTVLSFTPEQMILRELRRIPEERISACLGLPAGVVGLGAGLDRNTFTNFGEGREAAYESCLIPLQRLLVAEMQTQLVPDFDSLARIQVRFDLSQVRVLQQDQNALHQRIRDDVKAGIITVNEARIVLGFDSLEGADLLYLPSSVSPTGSEDLAERGEPQEEPTDDAPAPLQLTAPKHRAPFQVRDLAMVSRSNGVAH